MTIYDFKDYFFKEICVITYDGEKFYGILTGVENSFDTSSGEDEIELDVGDYYIDIEIPSIKSVKLISD